MQKDTSSIFELKSIRELKSKLTERERALSEPVLGDTSLLPAAMGWFTDIVAARHGDCHDKAVELRKKFLFVALLLFAPSALAGGRLPNGIRAGLSRLFPGLRPCVISSNIAGAVFLYTHYRDFRADCDAIFAEMLLRLPAGKLPRGG